MLCMRLRSLLLAISRRMRFSCSMWLRDVARLTPEVPFSVTPWWAAPPPPPEKPERADLCCRAEEEATGWCLCSGSSMKSLIGRPEHSSTVSPLL
jgi:hypothetical protein